MTTAPTAPRWPDEFGDPMAFVRQLWLGETAPPRPGVIFHQFADAPALPPDAPPSAQAAAAMDSALRLRVRNGDDYVPCLTLQCNPNDMVSAFGRGAQTVDAHWTGAVLPDITDTDRLVKPAADAGMVGRALALTRAARGLTDLPLRSLDLQSPLTIATQLLGVEGLLMAMHDDAARVHRLLDLLTDFTIDVVAAQRRAAGENFVPVFWPWIWAPPEVGVAVSDDFMLVLSPAQYDEFSVPCLQRLARHFGGLFLHSCTIYARNLPSLRQIPNLRGVNCDLSMSAGVREICDALPGVVFAPHVFMNQEKTRESQAAWLADTLAAWQPGDRLFPVVLQAIYDDTRHGDLPTDWAAVQQVWRQSGFAGAASD